MVSVEVENRSGEPVDAEGASQLARRLLGEEGVGEAEVGIHFVAADEIRRLKRDHLGVDEATDVLAFPVDSREELPPGIPRQLGDAVLCPQVAGEAWREALVHGLLHLLGFDHGAEMEAREARYRG